MAIENDKLVNLQDAKILYDDLRGRTEALIDDTSTALNKVLSAHKISEEFAETNGEVTDLKSAKAPIVTESISVPADVQTFSDGADGMLVKTLTVGIDPVQDLHGYDNPWPAGGGKNKVNSDLFNVANPPTGITLTAANGKLTANGSVSSSSTFAFFDITFPTGTYYLSCAKDGINLWLLKGYSYMLQDSGSFTVDDSTQVYRLALRFVADTTYTNAYVKDIQIEVGSSATSYAPYSNICPITGHTGANVSRTGKNLFDMALLNVSPITVTDDVATGTGNNFYNNFRNGITGLRIPSAQLTISAEAYTNGSAGTTGNGLLFRVFYTDGTNNTLYWENSTSSYTQKTITTNSQKTVSAIGISATSNGGNTWYLKNVQIELGSTASEYTTYSGSTAEYEFPQEAGTVYGGTLTIHQDGSGELVVDRATKTFNGTVDGWSYNVSGNNRRVYTTSLTSAIKGSSECISNYLKYNSSSQTYPPIGCIYANSYGTILVGVDSTITSADNWNTFLASNNLQVVYELATPVTYQLTNQQVILLLKGNNNLWSDVGKINAVDYPADTKLYIDGKIASLQALILENISNS